MQTLSSGHEFQLKYFPDGVDWGTKAWKMWPMHINHGSEFVKFLQDEHGYDARWIWDLHHRFGLAENRRDIHYWPGVDVVIQLAEQFSDEWAVFITRLKLTGELKEG